MNTKEIPYITLERNNDILELNTDLTVAHHTKLIMASLVDSTSLVEEFFSNMMTGKGHVTIRDRADIHFFHSLVSSEEDQYEYRMNKHDNQNVHGMLYSKKFDDYVFDWDKEGMVAVATRFLSLKKYLPVTEELVSQVLKNDIHQTIIESCDIYSTQEQLKDVGVWYINTDAFIQAVEQIDMEGDSYDWDTIEDIADYTVAFVEPIKKRLNDNIEVLYDENSVSKKMFEAREPYAGQIPLIQGGVETLKRKNNRFVYLAARQGTGKTTMSIKVNHTYHSDVNKNNYISMIIAPAITLTQWEEELLTNIADDIDIITLNTTSDLIRYYNQTKMKVNKPTYVLVGKETFKLSYDLKHATLPSKKIIDNKEVDVCLCPDCWKPVYNPLRTTETVYFTEEDFDKPMKSNYKCPNCDSVLFQAHYGKTKKTSVADFVRKRNIRFDSVIIDEIHESNNFDSIIGKATRDIVKQAKKSILLSGTISNGYASSVYNILFALIPNTLKKNNVFHKEEFVKAYGTLQGTRRIKEDEVHKVDRIEVTNSSMVEVEGINPLVYTKFFAENFIFAELEDIRPDLPDLQEHFVAVELTEEMQTSEKKLFEDMKKANPLNAAFYKDSVVKHYVNNPFHWREIPLSVEEETGKVLASVQPANIKEQLLPKEQKLIDICREEMSQGRKTWIYTDFVSRGKYVEEGDPLQDRLAKILEDAGIKVFVLRNTVKPIERKSVIEKNKDEYDVFISHPKLVSVGINLQFCTNYVFYTPSYLVGTVRQAKLRGRRANSTEINKVFHLYYTNKHKDSVEDDVMTRYRLKNAESEAIESNFGSGSDDGTKRTASGFGARIEQSLSEVVS